MLLSWMIGGRYYPVKYDYKAIAAFVLLAAVLVLLYRMPALLGHPLSVAGSLALGTVLLIPYAAACWKLIKKKRI